MPNLPNLSIGAKLYGIFALWLSATTGLLATAFTIARAPPR